MGLHAVGFYVGAKYDDNYMFTQLIGTVLDIAYFAMGWLVEKIIVYM